MRIRPSGLELLRVARTVLRERLAPTLDPNVRETLATAEHAMERAEERLANEAMPSGDDVFALETARATMRKVVLERLPKERRYDARMIDKAIAIATQELSNGSAPERRELEQLAALLDEQKPAAGNASDVRRELVVLNERLVARIRDGKADPETPDFANTLAHLEATTRQSLSESSPDDRRAASNRSGRPNRGRFDVA